MTPLPATKRARLDDAAAARSATTSAAASSIADPNGLELLTGALVVTRAFPQIAALPHVASTVSAFLDRCFHFKSLKDAVKTNDLRLLRRLVAASKWCPLRSNRRYPLFLRFQVLDAAKMVAECGFFEALKLLHEVNPHVIGNANKIFAVAAGRGDLETIIWLQ